MLIKFCDYLCLTTISGSGELKTMHVQEMKVSRENVLDSLDSAT